MVFDAFSSHSAGIGWAEFPQCGRELREESVRDAARWTQAARGVSLGWFNIYLRVGHGLFVSVNEEIKEIYIQLSLSPVSLYVHIRVVCEVHCLIKDAYPLLDERCGSVNTQHVHKWCFTSIIHLKSADLTESLQLYFNKVEKLYFNKVMTKLKCFATIFAHNRCLTFVILLDVYA